eukprot:TRINITY_DN21461_c0_g1_i1.p1 TRINITY_DN21461_c0_g1~~TRINITY_DN21461_c0_g1_i1.p1  ORF type:complete len:227 (-),score=52.48 TRINITY_DN21461_c0_g1_i1:424-1104(-)
MALSVPPPSRAAVVMSRIKGLLTVACVSFVAAHVVDDGSLMRQMEAFAKKLEAAPEPPILRSRLPADRVCSACVIVVEEFEGRLRAKIRSQGETGQRQKSLSEAEYTTELQATCKQEIVFSRGFAVEGGSWSDSAGGIVRGHWSTTTTTIPGLDHEPPRLNASRTLRRQLQAICKEILDTLGEDDLWQAFRKGDQSMNSSKICEKSMRLCGKRQARRHGGQRGMEL